MERGPLPDETASDSLNKRSDEVKDEECTEMGMTCDRAKKRASPVQHPSLGVITPAMEKLRSATIAGVTDYARATDLVHSLATEVCEVAGKSLLMWGAVATAGLAVGSIGVNVYNRIKKNSVLDMDQTSIGSARTFDVHRLAEKIATPQLTKSSATSSKPALSGASSRSPSPPASPSPKRRKTTPTTQERRSKEGSGETVAGRAMQRHRRQLMFADIEKNGPAKSHGEVRFNSGDGAEEETFDPEHLEEEKCDKLRKAGKGVEVAVNWGEAKPGFARTVDGGENDGKDVVLCVRMYREKPVKNVPRTDAEIVEKIIKDNTECSFYTFYECNKNTTDWREQQVSSRSLFILPSTKGEDGSMPGHGKVWHSWKEVHPDETGAVCWNELVSFPDFVIDEAREAFDYEP